MTRNSGLLERLERAGGASAGDEELPRGTDYSNAVRTIQARLLESHPSLLGEPSLSEMGRQRLGAAIRNVIAAESLASGRTAREALAETVLNEVSGLGPIEPLVQDSSVTEIMVNAPADVWVERNGRLQRTDVCFRDEQQLMDIIARTVAPLGRRIDQASPFVDCRLADGSRFHACIPPVSPKGAIITIRKFRKEGFRLDTLVGLGTLSLEAAEFLAACVKNRFNTIVAGGTGSGKTSTLNALLSGVSELGERVVTIEDCIELSPDVPNLVSLEARPPNLEGRGEITIRHLLRNALRMRPDRIVVGESRGAEAFDMLQAMNTGHQGSMSTVHANGPSDAIKRLEGMALMASDVPDRVVRELVPAALDVVVFQRRTNSGARRITSIGMLSKSTNSPSSIISIYELTSGDEADGTLSRTDAPFPHWVKARASQWG